MKKTLKTRIQDPEDFGLFFNCLVRRYQWDFDEELLDLMIRVLDHYLLYFSRRTLICAIRDLAGSHGLYRDTLEDVPEEQRERFDLTLKRMVKRYLSIELNGSTDELWNRMKIDELASQGEFTAYCRNEKHWMFPSKEAFATWVYENQLDRGDNLPLRKGVLLPIHPDFQPDFASLCLAAEQYSYGRLSYMPSTCRDFIRKNIALLSDDSIRRILEDIELSLTEHPIYPSGGGKGETKAWASYAKELRGELLTREWVAKAADYVRHSYDQFEEEIDEIIRLPTGATEDDCADIWCRLDGIYQYLMDRSNNCSDKKEHKKLVRWAKRYIAKKSQEIWERENGWKYVKVGRNMYYPRKDVYDCTREAERI